MSLGCYNTAREAALVLVMKHTEIQAAAAEAEEEEVVVEADQQNSIQLVRCFLLDCQLDHSAVVTDCEPCIK